MQIQYVSWNYDKDVKERNIGLVFVLYLAQNIDWINSLKDKRTAKK
jgi:hypothetical protein